MHPFLFKDRFGRASLILHMARPEEEVDVRDWRRVLLDRLRLGDAHERSFVLDVYEAMMIHHQEEAMARIRDARAVLTDPEASKDEKRSRDALSAAAWWGPLWAIERSDVDALRARPWLGYAYREGMALHRMSRRLIGGQTS